jgi:hypothetical protein
MKLIAREYCVLLHPSSTQSNRNLAWQLNELVHYVSSSFQDVEHVLWDKEREYELDFELALT